MKKTFLVLAIISSVIMDYAYPYSRSQEEKKWDIFLNLNGGFYKRSFEDFNAFIGERNERPGFNQEMFNQNTTGLGGIFGGGSGRNCFIFGYSMFDKSVARANISGAPAASEISLTEVSLRYRYYLKLKFESKKEKGKRSN